MSNTNGTPGTTGTKPDARRPAVATHAGVVIYDSSAESRDALTFGFERDDFEVYCAERAEEALQLLGVANAPLLVVSIGSSIEDRTAALSFIGGLRETPQFKQVAIVALGRRELREDCLRAGSDEFVAWPAFIRDAVTLARLAIAARGDESGNAVNGLLEDYEVYFLVRALASAGRSAMIELERAGHKGQLHFARGELVAARVGRLSGVAAVHHLFLWAEASMRLRFSSPPGERKIHAPIDDLLQSGVKFVEDFEKLAERVGGPQATFEKRPEKFADGSIKVPPEVRAFAETVTGGATLIDLVEASPFKPFDTIKVCFRLCDLGFMVKRDPVRSISPLTAQLAVRDWLLGTAVPEPRSTVTEAGRRAAEAYADAAAERARHQSAESDELFTDAVRPPAAVAPVAAPTVVETPGERPSAAPPVPVAVEDEVPTAPREPVKGPAARNKRRQSEQKSEERAAVLAPAKPPVAEATLPLAKLSREAVEEAHVKEAVFDEMDEAFFAEEHELATVEPVETFDDLDESLRHRKLSPKRKWSLFGTAPTPTPPTRKRR